MGDQILMKLDILKQFMSQSSYFKSRPDLVKLGGVGEETGDLGKRLEWRDQEETFQVGRISKCRRYVIDVTRLYPLSLWGLGWVQCFGEFGSSGRARTIKIGRHVRDLHKLT